jgi:hypothetical protein
LSMVDIYVKWIMKKCDGVCHGWTTSAKFMSSVQKVMSALKERLCNDKREGVRRSDRDTIII